MSQLTGMWTTLYAAFCEFIGTSPVVAIGSVSGVPCIVGGDLQDPSFLAGGIGSSGQTELQTPLASWTSGIPAKDDDVTVTGLPGSRTITAQVISTNERQGILYITIGDNSA